MKEIPFDQIRERLLQMPEQVQEAMVSPAMADRVSRIGIRHHLEENKIESLVHATSLLLLNFYSMENFSKQLSTDLVIPEQLASEIASDIETQIQEPLLKEQAPSLRPTGEPKKEASTVAGLPPTNLPTATNSPDITGTVSKPIEEETPAVQSQQAAKNDSAFQKPSEEKARPFNTDPYREPLA
jgi:hypothetical protein